MTNTAAPPEAEPKPTEAQQPTPPLLLLRHVTTFTANGQLPRRAWANASKTERTGYMNSIRANVLTTLEARFPDHFYDFVDFTVTDPPQDGSTLMMAKDRTLQTVVNARCVAMVYAPAFLPPSASARQAFLEWAGQAPGDLESDVLTRLADLWAQGTRPVNVVEGGAAVS